MDALKHVDSNLNDLISDLQTLIRQPSVSAKNEGIEECAKLVKKLLKKSGLKSEILRLKKGVAPIVYGEIKSKQNPTKTLMFYNHYDVQPAEPFDLWDDPPFSGTRKGNKIFGRGATDDKGELITRIKAVEACLKTTGDVPCSIKFVIEGEEETGSAHIEEYLKKYKKKFSCDGVIWEFGYVDAKNRPIIGLGMKGLLFVELSIKESIIDAHSSLAVLIKNPAWRLIEAIQTLRDSNGKILIKDWYKEVTPFSKKDLELIRKEPFDENVFKKEFGIKSFVGDKKGMDAKKAMVGGVTCNIAGFVSGYTGDGAKTVLPGEALVKIDFRLIENEIATPGDKDTYIVLKDPSGKVINAKGTFTLKDGTEAKYTDHTIVNYENSDLDVVMLVERKGDKYEKGSYPIEVYIDGKLVGEAYLILNDSFLGL